MVKKKVLIALLAAAILVVGISSAFAAEPDTPRDYKATFQKMIQIQKDLINKYLEAGIITPEQAQYMLDQLDLRLKYLESRNFGRGYGWGWGMGGMGGMMGGFGGFGFMPCHNW